MRKILLCSTFAIVFCSIAALGQSSIQISESKIRAVLKNDSTFISIPVFSSADHIIKAQLSLAWLDTNDHESGISRQDISIKPGQSDLEIPQRISDQSIWTRLRYSLVPDRSEARSSMPINGLVSLSHIADYVFELKLNYAGTVHAGKPLTVFGEAVHPVTRVPIPGVVWEAKLVDGKKELSRARISRVEGAFAEFVFDLPDALDDSKNLEVEVYGTRGDFEQSASIPLNIWDRLSARFQSDKPIYQPGQSIRLRAIILGPDGRAVQGTKVTLHIENQDRESVHTAQLTSSRFGIVQDDWTIPGNANLGPYQVYLTDQGDDEYRIATHIIRVSRYELPAFTVNAKPDHTAYLPTDQPRITITGTYLFGKPVPRGHIKIVRSAELQWNQVKHGPESEEIVAEGDAGNDGTFTTELDLKADFEDLRNTGSQRFRDLNFAAYFKDLTSNRTEQRRFDIRITLQPIHIYVIRSHAGGTLPVPLYICTYYADGRPASTTEVEIAFHGRKTNLHTNKYGVGKGFLRDDEEDDSEEGAEIKATDDKGVTGTWNERYWARGFSLLRLETGHTIHRSGEPVTITITSPPEGPADQSILIHAISGDMRVATRTVHLSNHKGEVTFPYQANFRKGVVFVAWNAADSRSDPRQSDLGSVAVVFPDGSDITISAKTERATYKPGETALLRMQVVSKAGSPVQAALGVAIVDQAVMERARTDNDFGMRSWFSCAFCGDDGENEIGGIRLNDLYALRSNLQISRELDLVAEALVAQHSIPFWSEAGECMADVPKFKAIESQMQQVTAALESHYLDSLEFPRDFTILTQVLGWRWNQLRDPWGTPFTANFSISGPDNVITFLSAGPDKRIGTEDDFVAKSFRRPFFTPIRHLIDEALKKVNFPFDRTEFISLLRTNGLLLDSLRDPWGTPYEIKITTMNAMRRIEIMSAGPDGKTKTRDDFLIAQFSGPYFRKEEGQITAALHNAAPQTVSEFRTVLEKSGIEISQFRDAWNRPYQVLSVIASSYDDQIQYTTAREFGGPATSRQDIIPVTRSYIVFSLHSLGPDGIENTYDDFDVARFRVLIKEESSQFETTKSGSASMLRGTGAISGTVTDATEAIIPGVLITLTNAEKMSYETETDQNGNYRFNSVPPGIYSIRAYLSGFMPYEVSRIPIADGKITTVDVALEIAKIESSVEVAAQTVELNTSSAAMVGSIPSATPRMREYFPETLLWIAEIITDERGFVHVPVPMADTVTTWKIAAVASTLDGLVAETESDFRAFQSFFLDFNPPPVLTVGDQVELPVTVRNYWDRPQKVSVGIVQNEWSLVQGSLERQVTVAANESINLTYVVQAKKARERATQRLIANAGSVGDAIEKSSHVHPDGQEVTRTLGDLVSGPTSLTVDISPFAIGGATRGELRVYPNLSSLLLESASAMIRVPHGCAEQTISTGYANLIAWQLANASGIQEKKIEKDALTNVKTAIEALHRFRTYGGGVSYWGNDNPDVAVTAYALGFLVEASSVVPIEKEDLEGLVSWLEKRQTADGVWTTTKFETNASDPKTLLLTSSVVRSLAAAQKAGIKIKSSVISGAYHHIARFTDTSDEPYMLASFVLATLDSGDEALLGNAVTKLAALGREERGGLYWDLRTNSPFYGWGSAGRCETTGLVLSALSAWRSKHREATGLDALIRRGIVFLVRKRGYEGMWFSTQSTLRAMHAMIDASRVLSLGALGGTIDIRSNGRFVKRIDVPGGSKNADPIIVDLSSFLSSNQNQIALTPSSGMQAALILFTSTHWLPWDQTKARTSPELRLNVQFNRLESRAGEIVRCFVKAERVGFRGYGMMLAEIGLPPGADVDRSSLESLLENKAVGVNRYEILPDRLLLYLWPSAGGAAFDFDLSIRSPLNAKSAPSVLYDYYNPEALSELPPFSWVVR